jgi:ATP-dependent DNA ligase
MSHETRQSLEKDGYRAQLARWADGRVLLRSRQGTDMTAAFPEIRDAALELLPHDTGVDGELVVWEAGRLAFERLQHRLARRRGVGALAAARTWPAHLVVFDVLRLRGVDLTAWPYVRRRAALEALFAEAALSAPFMLCPSTTDPATAREWLSWTAAGLEGLCFKRLSEPYRPGARTWTKYKVRATADAIVGAVTGPVAAPRTLLLGRHDGTGMLRYTGRTVPLARAATDALAGLLTPAEGEHPWTGRTFTAGWGSRDVLDVTLVVPQLVVEVAVDVARDAAGRWRHPVRLHRPRPDVPSGAVARFGD